MFNNVAMQQHILVKIITSSIFITQLHGINCLLFHVHYIFHYDVWCTMQRK